MKKAFVLKCLSGGVLLAALATPAVLAQEEGGGGGGGTFLIGPQAELGFVLNPSVPLAAGQNKPVGLLLGVYAGTSGLELLPSALIFEGQYRGFILTGGLRITPKWFGQEEYLFNLISPYVVLGGSLGYPWSVGWQAKAGLGVAAMQYGSINAEIGYRSHQLDSTIKLEGVTLGLRYGYPF